MATPVYPFSQYYLTPLASSGNDTSSNSSGSSSSLSSQNVNTANNNSSSFDVISGQVRDLSRRMTNAESAIIDLQNTAVRTGSDAVLRTLTAESITLSGSISANNARLGDWHIQDGKIHSTRLEIDSVNERIKSTNYLSGSRGFLISPDYIEAENIYARGTIGGATFKYDVISAVGGQLMVANSDVLNLDTTALDDAQFTFKGNTTFAVNDLLVCRCVTASGIQEEWVRVTNIDNAPRYVVTRDVKGDFAANANPIWPAGTTFVKQGSSNGSSTYSGGWLKLIGEGTNAPHYSVFTRTGVAYNAYTETVRMGNLNGIGGNTSDVYGFYAGNATQYFMWDGSEISATGYSLNILKTAGETISGATTPVPVYTQNDIDIATAPIMENNVSTANSNIYGVHWTCYSFRLDQYTNFISKFRVYLKKYGSPTGDITVGLYAADANFQPTGSVIEESTLDVSTISSADFVFYDFDFTTNSLDPNGTYSFVTTVPDGDVDNYIYYRVGETWEYTFIAGGSESTNAGSSWDAISTARTPVAITYGGYKSANTLGRAYISKSDDLNTLLFTGFAVSTADAGEQITIQIDGIVNGFTGLTTGANYFIQDDGTIGTSVGTYDRYVGYAVSTTALYLERNDFGIGYRPSEIERIGLDTARQALGATYSKIKDCTMYYNGTVRVTWEMKTDSEAGSDTQYKLYVNDVAVGMEWSCSKETGPANFGIYNDENYKTVTERVQVRAGDRLQLYAKFDTAHPQGTMRNFRVYFEYGTLDYKKNTD
jgi:hypothetical protein